MKKLLAILMCAVLLIGVLPAGLSVAAEIDFAVTGDWKNGALTFEWNPLQAIGYSVSEVKIGEDTVTIHGGLGKATVQIGEPNTTKTVSLGFVSVASGETEWVPVNVRYHFAMQVEAYKSNDKVHIAVTDEFGRCVPSGGRVTLTVGGTTILGALSDSGVADIPVAGYDTETTATVNIDDYAADNIFYHLAEPVSVDLTVQDRTIQLTMTLSARNGKIAAQVHGLNQEAVEGVEVSLTFGSNKGYETAVTDSEGFAYFHVASTTKTKVTCVVEDYTDRHIHYIGCSAVYGADTTTTQSRATAPTTTSTTANVPAKTTTFATFMGKGTTALVEEYPDYIALDVMFDQGVLNAFGLRESDFRNYAKLLMKKTEYDQWTGGDGSTVLLSVSYAKTEVSDEEVQQVIDTTYELMSYQPSAVARAAVVLSAKMLMPTGELVDLVLDNSEYIVRLPIPKNMGAVNLLAISQRINGTLSESVFASMRDGYFEFSTENLAELALMGVVSDTDTDNHYVIFTVILVALGVLLLAGAGVILYLFVIRKPAEQKAVPAAPLLTATEKEPPLPIIEDIYSDGDPFVVVSDQDVVVPPVEDSDSIELFGDTMIFHKHTDDKK